MLRPSEDAGHVELLGIPENIVQPLFDIAYLNGGPAHRCDVLVVGHFLLELGPLLKLENAAVGFQVAVFGGDLVGLLKHLLVHLENLLSLDFLKLLFANLVFIVVEQLAELGHVHAVHS
mmetsp:Transcript_21919/g.34055  ORF Transcript_21919/g.34055 Transcript_21919/m.34055 type:complete len:119 (-) Transcript_21919:174-530(-)